MSRPTNPTREKTRRPPRQHLVLTGQAHSHAQSRQPIIAEALGRSLHSGKQTAETTSPPLTPAGNKRYELHHNPIAATHRLGGICPAASSGMYLYVVDYPVLLLLKNLQASEYLSKQVGIIPNLVCPIISPFFPKPRSRVGQKEPPSSFVFLFSDQICSATFTTRTRRSALWRRSYFQSWEIYLAI